MTVKLRINGRTLEAEDGQTVLATGEALVERAMSKNPRSVLTSGQ